MNGSMLPLFITLSTPRERRGKVARLMIPAMVPVAESHRLAIASITADQQVRNEERTEENIARQVVSAVHTVIGKQGQSNGLTDEELSALPTLSGVVNRIPDLRKEIDSVAISVDQSITALQKNIVQDAITLIEIALGKPKDHKLAEIDLEQAPVLYALLKTNFPEELKEISDIQLIPT